MRQLRRLSALFALVAPGMVVAEAPAGYVSVNLNPYTNEDIRQSPYQTVASLPTGNTTITVGNTPFTLATYNGQTGTTGVVQTGPYTLGATAPTSVDIAANVAGAVEVETLISTTYGSLGALSGQIQFFGTGGAFASFNLVQGVNVRDYNVGSVFNNTIAVGTNTIAYTATTPTAGGTYATRLDEQIFTLPTVFATQTLTTIRLISSSNFVLDGSPFLVAASVAVPEPASATLVATAAILGLGYLVRCRTTVAHA